jgi:hypothetical protein
MEETERILHDGRYQCHRILGEGSMGRTYLATDVHTGATVAVKALYPSRLATVKDLELFEREATTLQRLEHPQIPRYIDAFHEGTGEAQCYFLVQTYIEGPTLREVIDGGARFDEAQIVRFLDHVASVLSYMHGLSPGVVHRDIKPSNIILVGDEKLPTLIDFGAVREVVRLTMGGGSTIIGTFGYMPPEQLMGRALPQTDLYALGITALECLTRRTPSDLHGEDSARMIDAVNVSDGLKRILRRLCAPTLAERYDTAAQLKADLAALNSNAALVHASQIESDIERRMREHQRQLKRETGIDIPVLFLVVVMMILAAGLMMLSLLIKTFIEDIGGGLALAMLISIVGALIPLGIKLKRYLHDVWSPPDREWIKTECIVRDVTAEVHVDHNTGREIHWFYLEYEFPIKGGMFRDKAFLGRSAEQRHYALKDTRHVLYYRPGHPEAHEFIDFLHGNYDPEAEKLFNHQVTHVPC